jgi:hypothetical protein
MSGDVHFDSLVSAIEGCREPDPALIATVVLAQLGNMTRASRDRLVAQALSGFVPGRTGA